MRCIAGLNLQCAVENAPAHLRNAAALRRRGPKTFHAGLYVEMELPLAPFVPAITTCAARWPSASHSPSTGYPTIPRGEVRVFFPPPAQADPLGGRAVKEDEVRAGFDRAVGFHESYMHTPTLGASDVLIGSITELPSRASLVCYSGNPPKRQGALMQIVLATADRRGPRPRYGARGCCRPRRHLISYSHGRTAPAVWTRERHTENQKANS
ncbi:hypothetical protein Bra1253DRAFT_06228 [Bradyrhizobium sp. WSM1253]|nr:hypothetical protein Bra1253DRAFT_06228 [Bradyrhizobium sp. WSM1253]